MTQEMVIDEVKKLTSPELLDTLFQYTRFLVEKGAAPYEDFKSEDEMNEFIAAFASEYFND
jgi:hypothetical protein